jgi:hypothetical protein
MNGILLLGVVVIARWFSGDYKNNRKGNGK